MTNRSIKIDEGVGVRLQAAERFFKDLTSVDVAVAAGSTFFRQGELLPAERAYIARAVEHRQREFALGRSLARAALSELGQRQVEIAAGADRAPIWPKGIIGSITHCDDLCVAAVARYSSGLRMIGIDLERTAANSDLLDIVSTVSERQQWRAEDLSPDVLATVCFSAKESVYKATYPSCRRHLEFHDVDLDIDFPGSRFTARLARHAGDNDEIGEIRGRFSIVNDVVITYAIA